MKKNGFTLVELLAVLVILAIIGLIVVPTVDRAIKRSRQELYDVQIANIEDAGKQWALEHLSQLPEAGAQGVSITIRELIEGGYLEGRIQNPKNKKYFDDDRSFVLVSKVGNNYKYEATVVDEN